MSNEKTGYNFIFDNQTVDILNIGAKAWSDTPASFHLGNQGYDSANENFRFLYTNNSDPWKQKTGFNQFYSSSFNSTPLAEYDIATNSSCPNFKKIIGFCGETDTAPDSSVKKLFKYDKTHRLRVKILDSKLLFSFGDNATDGVYYHTHYELKSKTGKLPSALIVGIQAQGGDGGDGVHPPISATIAGNGGGAGDCQYIVLDFKKAAETVHKQSVTYLAFDFYITPISNWSKIAYNGNKTRFTNDCVAINVRNTFYSDSASENLRSKIIIGCGQNGDWQNTKDNPGYGVAGTTMFYDLEASKALTKAELNNYGIYILTKHEAETTPNAGFGGAHEKGKNSNAYGILTTNIQSESTTDNITAQLSGNQNEVLKVQTGGDAGNSDQEVTRSGGGGASNFAVGGSGGNNNSNGGRGILGSGGGGGSPYTAGGKGGLPYIFFCSNIDFSITAK